MWGRLVMYANGSAYTQLNRLPHYCELGHSNSGISDYISLNSDNKKGAADTDIKECT